MRLPKVWVASIKIHDRLRSWNSSKKRDRRMSVQSYRKSLGVYGLVFDNVSDKDAACVCQLLATAILADILGPIFHFQTGYSSTRPHHLDETSTRTNVGSIV
jgi:hypothetical protein